MSITEPDDFEPATPDDVQMSASVTSDRNDHSDARPRDKDGATEEPEKKIKLEAIPGHPWYPLG
jgi:hypothetical protein